MCLLLAFFLGDAFLLQIHFITCYKQTPTYKHFDGFCAFVILKHVVPDFEIGQGFGFWGIIDQNGAMGVFHVIGDEASEAFLAGGIPQLNTVVFAIAGDVFDVEVDTDCGLG